MQILSKSAIQCLMLTAPLPSVWCLVSACQCQSCMMVSSPLMQGRAGHDACGEGSQALIFTCTVWHSTVQGTVHVYKVTLHQGWLPVDPEPVHEGELAPRAATPSSEAA